MNKHIVDITIIWPDDKWDDAQENEYLLSCLKGIKEHFEAHPIKNREIKRDIANLFGRVYAEIHINPCREG